MGVFGQVEEVLGFEVYMAVSSADMKQDDWEKVTSVNHVVVMKVVDGFEDLLDRLGSIFLRKLAVFADPVKQLSPGRQLGDYIIFVLYNINHQYCNFS